MRGRVVLPRILGFRIRGFQPVFSGPVELSAQPGINIILGGNAIGKTTVMQAIVYGATGGSEMFEDEKAFRWSHTYFRGRLGSTDARSAYVEVDIAFAGYECSVRRGFSGTDVLAFRDKSGRKWIEGRDQASNAFTEAVVRHGGYASLADFAFVVHRLLYLPESRRLLAWDIDAQLRLLMILNQDLAPERSFGERRQYLQLLDTKKRHTHVAITNADKQLSSLMEFDDSSDEDDSELVVADAAPSEQTLGEAITAMQTAANDRTRAQRDVDTASQLLTEVTEEIETLQARIDSEEAAMILRLLSDYERESQLALQKLVQRGICPACGTDQPALQATATDHIRHHGCALCGSAIGQEDVGALATLQSRLAEKLAAQRSLQEAHRTSTGRLSYLRALENAAQERVNDIRFRQPVVALMERNLPAHSRESLLALKEQLRADELDYEAQIEQLSRELDDDYASFRLAMSERTTRLETLYTAYATAFLGLPCELAASTGGDRLLHLTLFVPRFDDIERRTEESCSEAQRFFLDIAFRMALIDLASQLNSATSSFLCETPETALDLTYIQNVVDMFAGFAARRHVVILTANVQRSGVAEMLLRSFPPQGRRRRVLNLFDVGRLSSVQRANRRAIDRVVKSMLTKR